VPLFEADAAARASPDPGPEERAIAGDHAAVLRDALAALSPDQREVLALRFFGDLSGPEVAAVTGRRIGAVKALQHRGVRALERVLRDRGQLDALRSAAGSTRNPSWVRRAEQAGRTRDTEPEA
jgi:DNA-directed RNA polymerase specialized sigma24 family protein